MEKTCILSPIHLVTVVKSTVLLTGLAAGTPMDYRTPWLMLEIAMNPGIERSRFFCIFKIIFNNPGSCTMQLP